MRRYVWVCLLAVGGVFGCDSDDPVLGGDGGLLPDGSLIGGEGGVGGTGAVGGVGGTGGIVSLDDGGADDDGGVDPVGGSGGSSGSGAGGAGGGTGGLPTDGTRLAVCYSNADCDNGLECSIYGNNAGFCIETCTDSKDCTDIGSVTTTCGSNGVCRIDCGDNGTMGACPDGMECAEIMTGLPPLTMSTFRCQYPEGSGAKDTAAYGECDATRGDADCAGDLNCQGETGMCVATCMEDADCSDPGTDATPKCDKANILAPMGNCGLQCADDKDCPGDLLCQNPGLLGLGGVLSGKRCAAAP